MKYLLICLVFMCHIFFVAAQNTGIGTIVPAYPLTVKDTTGSGGNIGFAQVSQNGKVALGTYVDNSAAYLQTHTKNNLNFATNNGSAAMVLDTLSNLGVGVFNPTERLDVSGNVNFSGQLKAAGNAGTAGQVLMKNGSNNPVWADLSDYKYLATFQNVSTATSAGANNVNATWVVPAGVTSLYIEGWSGGGGGSTLSGGGGGGYMAFQATVTPGITLTIISGAGGSNGNSTTNGIPGGITSVNFNGGTYSVNGGQGGASGDPFTNFFVSTSASAGGGLSTAGAYTGHIISMYGNPGKSTTVSFNQVAAGEFGRIVNYGDGGDAAMFPGTAGKGGYRMISTTYTMSMFAGFGGPPGSGGASDGIGGRSGVGGTLIIHY